MKVRMGARRIDRGQKGGSKRSFCSQGARQERTSVGKDVYHVMQ
jgi:hypothetical protein